VVLPRGGKLLSRVLKSALWGVEGGLAHLVKSVGFAVFCDHSDCKEPQKTANA